MSTSPTPAGDRGPAYEDALAASKAAFAATGAVLDESPPVLDTVGDLAQLISHLPPEMGLWLGTAQIVNPTASAGLWLRAVVPSIIPLLVTETMVRDAGGREYATLLPALQLTDYHFPDGDTTSTDGEALDPYQRLVDACEHDGPRAILTVLSTLLTRIVGLLEDSSEPPLAYLRDDSETAADVIGAVARLSTLSVQFSALAPRAQAEEDNDARRAAE